MLLCWPICLCQRDFDNATIQSGSFCRTQQQVSRKTPKSHLPAFWAWVWRNRFRMLSWQPQKRIKQDLPAPSSRYCDALGISHFLLLHHWLQNPSLVAIMGSWTLFWWLTLDIWSKKHSNSLITAFWINTLEFLTYETFWQFNVCIPQTVKSSHIYMFSLPIACCYSLPMPPKPPFLLIP